MRRRKLLAAMAGATICARRAEANSPDGDNAALIFVGSRTRSSVAVIDSRTDGIVKHIAIPAVPTELLSLDKGARLAVADADGQQVWIVDVADGRIEQAVPLAIRPRLMQVNPAGTTFAVLDTVAGRVGLWRTGGASTTIAPVPEAARYAAFDARGNLLVAAGARVALLDPHAKAEGELVADAGDGPITHLASDPGGEYAFVAQGESGVLSMFELRTRMRRSMLHLPSPLGRILPSEDSQFVLVPAGRHSVSIISTWTLQESGRIRVPEAPVSIGLLFFQSVAAIATRNDRRLLLYDLRDRRPIADLRLPGVPEFGAASSDGLKYYLALPDAGRVLVVNLLGLSATRSIDDVGVGAWAVVAAVGENYCH